MSAEAPARDLRIGLVQAATLWHDPVANRALYEARVRSIASSCDMIVLPETFTSGFSNDAVAVAETMQDESVAWMRALAKELGVVLTGSIVLREGEQVFNRLLWAQPDGGLETYDKRHLFRMAGEHKRYAGGCRRLIVEWGGWRICPMVCYDLRFPVWSRNRFDPASGRLQYDLLLYVANWPAARRNAWRTLLRARAMENLACVVGVNRVGSDGNNVDYAGDSVALDALGDTLIEFGAQPAAACVTLSAEALTGHRARFPAHLDSDAFTLVDER
jgi:predicted amidohydrolase